MLLSEMSAKKRTVLLLDNPGLEIHVDGQKDIKSFLEKKVNFDCQIVFVTHSPAMIDPYNLAQLRKVELLSGNGGTKVRNTISPEPGKFDLLEPVRMAIGASLFSSLIVNDFNVLVEGASDRHILEGAFSKIESAHNVCVNGSLADSPDCMLATFYARTRLPFVAILDADDGGRRLRKQLLDHGIPENQIISLDSIIGKRDEDFAIEDVLSAEFYHRAVVDSYPGMDVTIPPKAATKRGNSYEFPPGGVRFSKRKVAETAKKLIENGEADEESWKSLQKIAAAILTNLEGQLTTESARVSRPDEEQTGGEKE